MKRNSRGHSSRFREKRRRHICPSSNHYIGINFFSLHSQNHWILYIHVRNLSFSVVKRFDRFTNAHQTTDNIGNISDNLNEIK